MIKFENTEVMNFEGAIRGMRNPLNSWDKSDSFACNGENCYISDCPYAYCTGGENYDDSECMLPDNVNYVIGPNDLSLMKRLIKAGSDHRKFMRQIIVSVDITAPLYWWKEMDQYRVAVVSNSCSTMHKIHSKPIEIDDFSVEKLSTGDYLRFIEYVRFLEDIRLTYLETNDKREWYTLIQLLPSSYNQKRTVTLNYETLYNIYGSRKNHKLDEWSVGFISWIESLPYAKELIVDRG